VVHFHNNFYINHNLPFGASSAAGLQGEVANATVDIWDHAKISPTWKWVDNFLVIRIPDPDSPFVTVSNGHIFRYCYDIQSAKDYVGPINILWHKDKGSDFIDVQDYVGYTFDFPNCTVSLPDLK
jgi:hypothetical protein